MDRREKRNHRNKQPEPWCSEYSPFHTGTHRILDRNLGQKQVDPAQKRSTSGEFQDCFQQFVGFQKWDDLDKNSKFYAEELRSITGSDPVMPFEVPYSVCGVCLDYKQQVSIKNDQQN